jgi:hypothetical protein
MRYARDAAGRRMGRAGAAGVERTTRRACAAPGRLGSIPARLVRRRLEGTGPFDPDRTHSPHPAACLGAIVLSEVARCRRSVW